jgi:hypothetical protein
LTGFQDLSFASELVELSGVGRFNFAGGAMKLQTLTGFQDLSFASELLGLSGVGWFNLPEAG